MFRVFTSLRSRVIAFFKFRHVAHAGPRTRRDVRWGALAQSPSARRESGDESARSSIGSSISSLVGVVTTGNKNHWKAETFALLIDVHMFVSEIKINW